MSVCKLLSRILAPKLEPQTTFDEVNQGSSKSLGASTLGGSEKSMNDDSEGSSGSSESDDSDESDSEESIDEDLKQRIHDHTYGITR